jgi:hypothetical protein
MGDKYSITIICREVDKSTGNIAVYKVMDGATDHDIQALKIRETMNQELTYFAGISYVVDDNWENIEETLSQREFYLDESLLVHIGRR